MFYTEPYVTLAYSRPLYIQVLAYWDPKEYSETCQHVWRAVFYRTLCNTGIFRTRGILKALSNIYDGKFYSQHCANLACLKPWQIQNPRHIQNTVKQLSRSSLFKTLCNPDMFITLVYSQLWYILKSKLV